jgi:hypothetical protein
VKHLAWPLAWAVSLTGCGYVGAPMPPALDIPSRVTDLRAAEFGENIQAEFTLPALTTEGLALKTVRSVQLRVAAEGQAAMFEVPAKGPGPLSHMVPAREWIGKDLTLSVRATGPKGKASDWSNAVALHVDTPLRQPADLKADNAEGGVRLAWSGPSSRYRIFRAVDNQKPERLAEVEGPEYLDESTQYGTRYQYFVQAIAGESQQSEVAGPVEKIPKDEFPPAVPAGLMGVPDVTTIELAWERNTESDFKGYNVFRSTEGGPFEQVASLIEAPAYSDHQVEAGKKYRYAVSAVDLTGNESQRSEVQEVTAQ